MHPSETSYRVRGYEDIHYSENEERYFNNRKEANAFIHKLRLTYPNWLITLEKCKCSLYSCSAWEEVRLD